MSQTAIETVPEAKLFYVIPKQCKVGVVVNEGFSDRDFRVRVGARTQESAEESTYLKCKKIFGF
jgi:hypothetical protein